MSFPLSVHYVYVPVLTLTHSLQGENENNVLRQDRLT
jgi:hypothetical protein